MVDEATTIAVMQRASVFSSVPVEKLGFLMGAMVERHLLKDDVLYRQGDPGDAMAVVLEGGLEVVVTGESGALVRVTVLRESGIVGEMALLDPCPRSATILAVEPTRVLELTRTTLDAIRDNAPDVAVQLVHGITGELARRIRATNEEIARRITRVRQGISPESPAPNALPRRQLKPSDDFLRGKPNEPAFFPLSDDDLALLEGIVGSKHFDAGHVLCNEGESGNSCFFLQAGEVEVIKDVGGMGRLLATIPPGGVVGQLSVIDAGLRSATLRARTPIDVIEVTREQLSELVAGMNPLGVRFDHHVAVTGIRQLRAATSLLACLDRILPEVVSVSMSHARPAAEAQPIPSQPAPNASQAKRQAESPEAVPRPAKPGSAEELAVTLAYMEAALDEWGMSLEELDDVEVVRPEGVVSADEARARDKLP